MRIIFITDLHIDQDLSRTKGLDNFKRFEIVLNDSLKHAPDMIVLGGDLCNVDGEESTYLKVKELMDATNISYHVIPGNHDDGALINEVFYNENRLESYRMKQSDVVNMIFLDSCKGTMSDEQWTWLTSSIEVSPKNLIFMHHPPVLCGSAHMEPKWAFKEIERFESVYKNKANQINVVTGHFHMDRVVMREGISVFVTPSTYLQIDPNYKELTVDTTYAAYRIIELDNENFKTYLIRINF